MSKKCQSAMTSLQLSLLPLAGLFLSFSGVARGQSPSPEWARAILSAILDKDSSSLRVVYGYPGAAYVGDIVLPNVQQAWTSPDGHWTLAKRSEDVALFAYGKWQEPVLRLPAPSDSVFAALWSSDSAAFVLQKEIPPRASAEAAQNQLTVYRQTQGAWRIWATEVSLLAGCGETACSLRILAIDAARKRLWAAWREGSEGDASPVSIDLSNSDDGLALKEKVELVLAKQAPGALAVCSGPSDTVYLAGETGNSVLRLERISGSWRPSIVYSGEANRQVVSLWCLPNGEVLSGWRSAPDKEEVASVSARSTDFIVHHAFSSNESAAQAYRLDGSIERFTLLDGAGAVLVRQSIGKTDDLLLYDFNARTVLFVPALPLAGANANDGSVNQ